MHIFKVWRIEVGRKPKRKLQQDVKVNSTKVYSIKEQKDIERYPNPIKCLIIRRWSTTLPPCSAALPPFNKNTAPVSLNLDWVEHQMENQRMDIRVLTLLSLSSFLALGVLFNLCSSSITSFSTVSIEFNSFLCGVRHSESPELLWLVISSNIFGTLPTDLGWYLLLVFGRGVIKVLVCSSWAPDVDSVWSWGTTVSSCSPSLSLKRALVLSMAYGGKPITIRLI